MFRVEDYAERMFLMVPLVGYGKGCCGGGASRGRIIRGRGDCGCGVVVHGRVGSGYDEESGAFVLVLNRRCYFDIDGLCEDVAVG